MVRKSPKDVMTFMFLILLVVGVVLVGGCAGKEVTPPSTQSGGTIKYITPQEAFALIEENSNNPDFVIIGVRSPQSFKKGHIEGAINIPLNIRNITTFQDEVNKLDKNKSYLTYCPDGCGRAADIMREMNFQRIYDILGGYNRWKREGLPIVE